MKLKRIKMWIVLLFFSYNVISQTYQTNLTLNSMQISDLIPLMAIPFSETKIDYERLLDNEFVNESRHINFIKNEFYLAEVLITQSSFGIYDFQNEWFEENSKGEIFEWFKSEIDNHQFNICAITKNVGLEYGLMFSLRIDNSSLLTLYNLPSAEEYNTNYEYYNFQIWAMDLKDLKSIVKHILFVANHSKEKARIIYNSFENRMNSSLDFTEQNETITEIYDLLGRRLSSMPSNQFNKIDFCDQYKGKSQGIIKVIRDKRKILSSKQVMLLE